MTVALPALLVSVKNVAPGPLPVAVMVALPAVLEFANTDISTGVGVVDDDRVAGRARA